ncbi:MAG: peroxiredoxin [Myxococcota bacterium]|jgi:peroxiredoxin Q/BCP|nr:peroxiredoxin [Myxococcota bacterium]
MVQRYRTLLLGGLLMALAIFGSSTAAAAPGVGSQAPLFTATAHDGSTFSLADRQGKGWTVLFFYPKADTPGCTKQACAFRDANAVIRELGAEVYGISGDSVKDQAAFHAKYRLTFPLLADPEARVIQLFDAKLPLVKVSKRWTFILDPTLTIRWVEKDVDPMLDAQRVADELKRLQGLPK